METAKWKKNGLRKEEISKKKEHARKEALIKEIPKNESAKEIYSEKRYNQKKNLKNWKARSSSKFGQTLMRFYRRIYN